MNSLSVEQINKILVSSSDVTKVKDKNRRFMNGPCITESKKHSSHNRKYNFPHYYRVFFNLLHIFLFSPFWVSFSKESLEFKLETNLVKKVVCACLHLALGLAAFVNISSVLSNSIMENPAILFSLFCSFSWALNLLVWILTVWNKSNDICRILQVPCKNPTWKNHGVGAFMGISAVIQVLTYYGGFVVFDDDFKLKQFMSESVSELYATFGWNGTNPTTLLIGEMSPWEQVAASGWVVLNIYYILILTFMDILFVLSSMTVYEIVATMSINIQQEISENTLEKRLHLFKMMKEDIWKINQVSSLFVLSKLLEMMSFVSETFVDVLDEDQWARRAAMFQVYFVNIVGFLLAAESYSKVRRLEKWIHREHFVNKNNVNKERFGDFFVRKSMEMCPGDMGMTGGRFFTVSYPFLGELVTVFLMYVIVMVQFKAHPKTTVCLNIIT